jgi:hypothetical protein
MSGLQQQAECCAPAIIASAQCNGFSFLFGAEDVLGMCERRTDPSQF